MSRRVLTIPLYFLLFGLLLLSSPLWLPLALLSDFIRGAPWTVTRCLLFFLYYLGFEVVGIAVSGALWLASGAWAGRGRERYLDWNYRLQWWWGRGLFRGAQRIFGLQPIVEGLDEITPGPKIVLVRHASVGDTVIPATYLSSLRRLRLRYVLKRELLWDPCLDIVGNRIPNVFVNRGSEHSEREIAAVGRLADDLGESDGVLIYPEGTRFTPAKRERALERLAGSDHPGLARRAAELRQVLPPRLGGVLALLERNRGADVVFCAHTGFEGAGTFADLLAGSLVNRKVRVKFWQVPFAGLPAARDEQVRWLYDHWMQVDEFVTRYREP